MLVTMTTVADFQNYENLPMQYTEIFFTPQNLKN